MNNSSTPDVSKLSYDLEELKKRVGYHSLFIYLAGTALVMVITGLWVLIVKGSYALATAQMKDKIEVAVRDVKQEAKKEYQAISSTVNELGPRIERLGKSIKATRVCEHEASTRLHEHGMVSVSLDAVIKDDDKVSLRVESSDCNVQDFTLVVGNIKKWKCENEEFNIVVKKIDSEEKRSCVEYQLVRRGS